MAKKGRAEMKEYNHVALQSSERDAGLRFDNYGRLMSMEESDLPSDPEPIVLSERVNEVFMGMTYMKENCSGGAC